MFYHEDLLPKNLSLSQAQQVLAKNFEGCILIGVDEAGRGPLAGPVVAAAVVAGAGSKPSPETSASINDSKKLSEKRRDELFEELKNCCEYSIGEACVQEIDEMGILNANFLAMRRALAPLISKLKNPKILVDGNLYIREVEKDMQMPIIKGDARVACIAAASIFAKAHRDNLMRSFAKNFPQYGFEKHKGYGTKAHMAAIEKFGLCEIHRRSYAPNIRFIP